jgi:hypothetical protein
MDGWIEEESGSCSFSDECVYIGGGGGVGVAGLQKVSWPLESGAETYDETMWENMSVYVCQIYGLERVKWK